MFSSRFLALARVHSLPRREGVSDRAVALGLMARFVDEVLAGAFSVLAPTFRRTFGLSLVAVSLLEQVLNWVALMIEPPAALLIDVRSRRVLMSVGASFVGVAVLLMGLAPTYAALLAGFAAYGIGSGPLAHTADVVLVESYPDHGERIFSRATFIDTVGALSAPLLIAAAAAAGISWRVVLVVLGIGGLAYARALAWTPLPTSAAPSSEAPLWRQLGSNLRDVARDRGARSWLFLLLVFDLVEAPHALKYVWLHEQVGMSQALVAVYAAGEQLVGLAALVALDRWLERFGWRPVLAAACVGLVLLPPAWLYAPGIAGRVAVGIPLAFVTALVWPIAKARAILSLPGRAGAVSAVSNLFGILPLTLLFGTLAEWIGLTRAMLAASLTGGVLLTMAALIVPASSERTGMEDTDEG